MFRTSTMLSSNDKAQTTGKMSEQKEIIIIKINQRPMFKERKNHE